MRIERFPVAAIVVTAVFAIEGAARSGADLSIAESRVFYGLATVLAPTMQLFSMSDARPAAIFAAIIAMLFIILAFVETAIYIVLRKTTPAVRWTVRATAAVIALALLLFTPAVGPIPFRPMPVLDYGFLPLGPQPPIGL